MILDRGICTVFRKTDTSAPGGMPSWAYTPIWASWYGEANFETTGRWQTEGRKELKADAKIRVMQCRQIRQNDIVVLEHLENFDSRSPDAEIFQIIRAYHGRDDDGPTPISDLTLEVITP